MTDVLQRRSNKNTTTHSTLDETTTMDDDPNTTQQQQQLRSNHHGINNSSNNANNGTSQQYHPKRKSRSDLWSFTTSSNHTTTVIQYIVILTTILLGMTVLHQWEHPTTTTTPIYTTMVMNQKSHPLMDAAMIRQTIMQNQQKRDRNNNNNQNQNQNNNRTIAYVVTITSCNGHARDNTFQIVEGASVLRHSIHRNSIRASSTNSNTSTTTSTTAHHHSAFDYQLYAFYHPDAVACAIPLLEFGYIIEARPTPVRVEDIQNPLLQERIVKNGCCGEKELIKFEAFTLTSYPLVVLLDIDTLILQPLDRLFRFMLDTSFVPDDDDLLYYPHRSATAGRNTNVTIFSKTMDLLYTTDYAMVNADRYIKPVQGGFVILRPNQTVYNDFVRIVQIGDFQFEGNTDLGWGGRTGRFWGGTYQCFFLFYGVLLWVNRTDLNEFIVFICFFLTSQFCKNMKIHSHDISRFDAILFSSTLSRSSHGIELVSLQ
jgi:hypothetical protein